MHIQRKVYLISVYPKATLYREFDESIVEQNVYNCFKLKLPKIELLSLAAFQCRHVTLLSGGTLRDDNRLRFNGLQESSSCSGYNLSVVH